MIPAERQKKIISLISNHQVVSINTLVEHLGVSHMTIRRDIKALETSGQVVCVSGGVQLIERLITEPTHDTKALQSVEEKRAIGLEAAKYVPLRGTVFLDAGTTTFEIAKHIAHNEDLIVITNDFEIARYLMREGTCKLLHTGGTVNRANLACVGDLTASFISKLSIDVSFISTSSWGADGTTTPDETKILVKRAITKQSRVNILVTDSSKYGKVATFQICDLSVFDMIITDSNLRNKSRALIDRRGIEVITVEPLRKGQAVQPTRSTIEHKVMDDTYQDYETREASHRLPRDPAERTRTLLREREIQPDRDLELDLEHDLRERSRDPKDRYYRERDREHERLQSRYAYYDDLDDDDYDDDEIDYENFQMANLGRNSRKPSDNN